MKLRWPNSLSIAFVATCIMALVAYALGVLAVGVSPIMQKVRYARLWIQTSMDTVPNSFRDVRDKFSTRRPALEALMKRLPDCKVEGDLTEAPPIPSWSDNPKKRRGIVCDDDRSKTDAFATAMRKAGVVAVDWTYSDGHIDVAEFYLAVANRNGRTEALSIRYGGGYRDGPPGSSPALYLEDNGACRIEQRSLTDAPYHWFWWRRLYDPKVPESKYCYRIW